MLKDLNLFVDTLTIPELMVCKPIIVHQTILRSRTTQIPVQKYGTIAFPLITKPMEHHWKATSLPWSNFKQLPFIVIVHRKNDKVLQQARVNLQNIRQMQYYMTKEVRCPISNSTRPFYEFVNDIGMYGCCFSEEQFQNLDSEIDKETDLPKNLRTFQMSELTKIYKSVLTLQSFKHWMNLNDLIAAKVWAAFLAETSELDAEESITFDHLWDKILNFIAEDDPTIVFTDDAPIESYMTIEIMAKYFIHKNWLWSDEKSEEAKQDLLCSLALEFQQASQSYSNDGGREHATLGHVQNSTDTDPESILQRGMKDTLLNQVSVQSAKERPIPEWSYGFFQMAYPEVFLSGHGNPYQIRSKNIRDLPQWEFKYLNWIAYQDRARNNAALQFHINNVKKRKQANIAANLIVKNVDITGELPTKEEFRNSAKNAAKISTVIMQYKAQVTDSPSFWQNQKYAEIGTARHLETVDLNLRPEKPWPYLGSIFTTSAIPYVDAYYIHNLMENDTRQDLNISSQENCTDIDRLIRRSNCLKYPQVVDYMTSLIAELQTRYISKSRHKSDYSISRFEWGDNENPHFHSTFFSEKLGKLVSTSEVALKSLLGDLSKTDIELNDEVKLNIEERLFHEWQKHQEKIISFFDQQYINWNPGLTAEGTPTYDYSEHPLDLSKLNLAEVIDNALYSGNFAELDDIFVRICFRSLLHVHNGINGRPKKDHDYCYKKVTKVSTVTKVENGRTFTEKVKKTYAGCKRRKPQPERGCPAIYKDPHDKTITHLGLNAMMGFSTAVMK